MRESMDTDDKEMWDVQGKDASVSEVGRGNTAYAMKWKRRKSSTV
jgi:hypothetical protein